MALEQVFSEYFSFPCKFSFHRLLHTHHVSSGAGTIGELVIDVPRGLSPFFNLVCEAIGTADTPGLLCVSGDSEDDCGEADGM
jgi:hypothetical protein